MAIEMAIEIARTIHTPQNTFVKLIKSMREIVEDRLCPESGNHRKEEGNTTFAALTNRIHLTDDNTVI
jgi:hypothetical protein